MSSNAPVEHIEESLKLQADDTVDLFEAQLKISPTIVRFWNGPTRTWQGNEYAGMACQLKGEARATDGKTPRPQLTINNPDNIFGSFAAEGFFDLALIIRKRVLQSHFNNDVNIFQQSIWICGRPLSVTDQVLTLELRAPTDQPTWLTPRRRYVPPEYPFVVFG